MERLTLQQVSVDNSLGINARAGYRFLSWLAAELEYEWTSGFEVKGTGGAKPLSLEGNMLTLKAKFILPTGRVQPYLLAGFGGTQFGVNDQESGPDGGPGSPRSHHHVEKDGAEA